MSAHFYRLVEHIRIFKSKLNEHREKAIRLFCEHEGQIWALQVRAPMSLGSSGYGKEGKDYIIAGASLSVDDMRALRDAINVSLADTVDGTKLYELYRQAQEDAGCEVMEWEDLDQYDTAAWYSLAEKVTIK